MRPLTALMIMDLEEDFLYLNTNPLYQLYAIDSPALALPSLGGKHAHFSGLLKAHKAVGGTETLPMI